MKAKRNVRLMFWPVISISARRRACATQVILAIILFGSCSLDVQADQPNDSNHASPPSSSESNVISSNALVSQSLDGARLSVAVDYSYVTPGYTNFSEAKGGSSGAQSVTVGVMGNVPLNERWFVPLEIGWGDILLDSVPGEPVPGQINGLRLLAGLGYRINEQWTVAAYTGPALYRFEDIQGDDIGVGGIGRAVYRP